MKQVVNKHTYNTNKNIKYSPFVAVLYLIRGGGGEGEAVQETADTASRHRVKGTVGTPSVRHVPGPSREPFSSPRISRLNGLSVSVCHICCTSAQPPSLPWTSEPGRMELGEGPTPGTQEYCPEAKQDQVLVLCLKDGTELCCTMGSPEARLSSHFHNVATHHTATQHNASHRNATF